jgi:sulfotransferase family protein
LQGNDLESPLVIGGLGGSGTRVFTRVVQLGGTFMGAGMPESEDTVALEEFADKWTVPYAAARVSGQPLSGHEVMSREFQECIERHREPIGGSNVRWGWKKPQNIHLLPFLIDHFPKLRFVHVVRDGRDLAFGGRSRPDITSAYVDPELAHEAEPVRMLAFWAAANKLAKAVGDERLKDTYLVLRFEDLCHEPGPTVERLLRFSGADPSDRTLVAKAVAEVELSDSLGRWRSADPKLVEASVEIGAQALKQFGYD